MSAVLFPKAPLEPFHVQPLTGVILAAEAVTIPSWVKDPASFRQWSTSQEFPPQGRICYLNGQIWVDLSREQFFSHNQVKEEILWVLGRLARERRLGRCIPDGMRLVHAGANLSCEPDGCFVLRETISAGRWKIVEDPDGNQLEMEGTPDMVLEILRKSSEQKDEVTLKQLYAAAGIPEYWLVDARQEPLSFEILQLTRDGYQPVKTQRGGWHKSKVFGCSFRLTQSINEFGEPEFHLEVR